MRKCSKESKRISRAEEEGYKKPKKKKLKRIFFMFVIILVMILGSSLAFLRSKLEKINHVKLDNKELGISSNVAKGYKNIALLAVDSRNVKSNDGSRSDGIIVMSLNNNEKEARLISVYRDTYVEVEGHGLTKITHAYAYGGPKLAIKTLNTNLDLNISDFVTVNFEVVAEAIDAMGGIEIEIQKDELAEMNKYITDTSKHTGIASKKLSSAGKQKLNGVQAVTYGRIRNTEGGDYRRTERMRTVIMKAFEKAKKMDINTLNRIIDKVLPKIQTSISSEEIIGLMVQMMSYEIKDNIGWPYETKGKTLDAWYGIPITLETNVTKLHKEVFLQNEYEPSSKIKEINKKIINKTGYTK